MLFKSFHLPAVLKPSHYLRLIKPLWLREKIYFRFHKCLSSYKASNLFNNASLSFTPWIKLDLSETDISHQQIACTGFYELEVTKKINQLARKPGLLIDVGANYGYYACLWAGLNRNNQVLAFEASPKNIPMLTNNIKQNSLERQIEIMELAVSKKNGKIYFTMGPEEQTGWGGISNEFHEGYLEIPAVCLDSIISERVSRDIEVLKIDVEGADVWVLEGAKQLLREHKIRHILFEENIERMKTLSISPGEGQKLLRSFGYQVKVLSVAQLYGYLTE